MRVEEIDALLGGEAQRLADQYRAVPLDFMDGYGWAVTQICRLFPDETPVIRCKDCKYYEEQDETIGTCLLTESGAHIKGYCSWAERKEE